MADDTRDGRTTPSRQRNRWLDRKRRAALEHARQQLLEQLACTDRALQALAEDRSRIAAQLEDLREELWPPTAWPVGRRPGRDTLAEPLPPLPERPTWLWGRQLRAVCLRLLARCGTLGLRQLHAMLHLLGFGVAGGQPVKVLADALGHEADAGLAVREARGRYRVSEEYRPARRSDLYLAAVHLPADDG
jgi:hypothetical protein